MSHLRSRLALLVALSAATVIAACGGSVTLPDGDGGAASSDNSSSGNNAGEARGIGYGCCPPPASPPTCANMGDVGGTKQGPSSGDCHNGGYDAVYDPTAPGWALEDDLNGCPIWQSPPGNHLVVCNAIDSGISPPKDASAE